MTSERRERDSGAPGGMRAGGEAGGPERTGAAVPRPFTGPTPRSSHPIVVPRDRRPTPPFMPGQRWQAAPTEAPPPAEALATVGIPAAAASSLPAAASVATDTSRPAEVAPAAGAREEVGRASSPGRAAGGELRAEDAWEWGQDIEAETDDFGFPLAIGGEFRAPAAPAADSSSVEFAGGEWSGASPTAAAAVHAASALEALARRLRDGSLQLADGAAVGSEEAALAATLAALFAARTR